MAPHFLNEKLDPDLKFVSSNKKHLRPEAEKAVSYMRDVTVILENIRSIR